jgi:hypothetical protein
MEADIRNSEVGDLEKEKKKGLAALARQLLARTNPRAF